MDVMQYFRERVMGRAALNHLNLGHRCLNFMRKTAIHPVLHGLSLLCHLVVLMTAAPCINKDLRINGYKKGTWIKLFINNVSVSIHVEIV